MGDFMRIKTFAQTKKYTGNYLMDRTVIVVDVLRATSSIIWACRNGANRVIPVSDAGEGAAIAARLGDCIMAGERGGVKLPGFDLGNSPLEFDHRIVKDRNVIINTTNGTGAIKAAEGAAHVLIGAMINHTAVARMAAQLDRDVIILCAGTEGEFSADDICAAGAIATSLCKLGQVSAQCDLTLVAKSLYSDWREARADLSKTYHYARLVDLGFEEDVQFCFQEDITDVVPVYRDGFIHV
ncbi:MAG: 2-phosphosulfolactate phosphatase [Clostridiales bacterium]|jgi:2-phosphosulfolactate phosphatase|nr:MAG: 2-phosphosulfolactate phosphatase [Clostridiales bacterium]